jgi:hypothetical protein
MRDGLEADKAEPLTRVQEIRETSAVDAVLGAAKAAAMPAATATPSSASSSSLSSSTKDEDDDM